MNNMFQPPMMQGPPFMMPRGGPGMGPTSNLAPPLYVGDLDENVREEALYDLFSKFGQIYYIRLMKDPGSGKSRGFAYVNFCNARDAENAKHVAQYEKLGRKHIRIMYKRPNIKNQNSEANIFVKNIDKAATIKEVHQEWSKFGNIFSAKLAVDSKGESLGYAYIQFDKVEDAKKALEAARDGKYKFKETYVTASEFKPRSEREGPADDTGAKKHVNNNLYIKHLPEGDEKLLEDKIRKEFAKFGTINMMAVKKDNKINKYFSFVCFEEEGAAEKAIAYYTTHPNPFDASQPQLYVSLSQTRRQRDETLSKQKSQTNHQNNLFLKNLKPEVNKKTLSDNFAPYGNVVSCDVKERPAPGPDQTKKVQYGFVAFSSVEEATKARAEAPENEEIKKMYIDGKPYINVFQPKDERQRFLKTQWRNSHFMPGMGGYPPMMQNRRPPQMAPFPMAQGYPPMGGPGGIPGMRPQPQLGYGGNRKPGFPQPMGGPMQNRGPRPQGGRPQGGHPGGQFNPNAGGPRPMGNTGGFPQQRPMGQNRGPYGEQQQNRRPPGPQGTQQPSGQLEQQLPSQQQPQQQLRPQQPQQMTSGIGLTFGDVKKKWNEFLALEKEKQRNILGEMLYPMIKEEIGDKDAPKITGMLIDLDVLEIEDIAEILENRELLKERIHEALELIQNEGA